MRSRTGTYSSISLALKSTPPLATRSPLKNLHTRFYDLLLAPMERSGLARLRQATVGQARGRVLEIGIGTGLNLPWYPSVGLLVGVDPDPDMLAGAQSRLGIFQGPAQVGLANGEALPFRDASFETVVGTLVFCTIPDPFRALQEVARVLAPGGVVYLLEHVRSPIPLVGRLQDWITPLWSAVCGGCHPNRETVKTVEAAGLRVVWSEAHLGGLVVRLEAVSD